MINVRGRDLFVWNNVPWGAIRETGRAVDAVIPDRRDMSTAWRVRPRTCERGERRTGLTIFSA